MGQKVNPVGLRIGIYKDWTSRWYADKDEFAAFIKEDLDIRKYLKKELKAALLSRVEIERVKTDKGHLVNIFVHVGRPGVVLGQASENINRITKHLRKVVKSGTVRVTVVEVKDQYLDAQLVAQWIANELENRASFRTAQKRAIQNVRRAGAKGIKTQVSGRLGGHDIARAEGYKEGTTPLHTLRSDIDYAHVEAHTTYGRLGVKVWICRGEIIPDEKKTVTEGEE